MIFEESKSNLALLIIALGGIHTKAACIKSDDTDSASRNKKKNDEKLNSRADRTESDALNDTITIVFLSENARE